MDNKSIFVRTSTGEEQVQSRTSPLSGDVKRALSMVDGVSTFGEISKRAAPSMRANLAEMFEELEKSGLIQEKSFAGKIPKSAAPTKMAMPVKIATPRKPAPEKVSDELDFMSSFQTSTRADTADDGKDAILREAEEEARLRLEAADREQREAEAARTKAEQEARRVREELEAARLKAEQEARLRLEAAERERKEAEAARIKAEQEARRVREELEAAKLKAEQEARLRLEAEERERKEAEAARIKAENEAARIRAEQEAARIKAEQEAAQRQAEQERERRKAELEAEAARKRAEQEAEQARKAAEAREKSAGPDAGVTGSFAFDAFKIDEIQPGAPQKKPEPAQKPGSGESAAAKQDAFAFDSFNVEEQRPAEPPKERQAAKAAQAEEEAAPPRAVTPTVTNEAAAREKSEREKSDREKAEKEKAEKERAKREAQARIAEEARIRELADAEAKVWAEAEQRALESARVNAERAAQLAERPQTARAEKARRPARAPRKPFAWGKLFGSIVMLGIFLLVLLVGALFVAPYVLPTRDYMPKVQQLLSDELHQPVHLGYLSGRFLPTPRLDLGEIYIGDAKQFQAATAQINFDIFGVFGDSKPIDSVDFQKVTVRGIALRDSGAWLQKLAGSSQFPVSKMTISESTLDADVFQLTGVEGQLDFGPAGKFTHAGFSANAGKYSVTIDPLAGGKFRTNIMVHAGALPLLPSWNFDELDANGEISGDELLISKFDARMLDGTLQGNAHLTWHSGWHADGTITAKKIVMKDFSKLLDGNVDGSARFRMSSPDLGGLTDSAILDGSFVSADGLIGGLDIVETARTRSRTNLPGGRTHYDHLRGEFSYSKGGYHFTQVKIDGGVMNVLASFDISNQLLTGKMKVDLAMHGLASTELHLGGAIDDPTLVYAP